MGEEFEHAVVLWSEEKESVQELPEVIVVWFWVVVVLVPRWIDTRPSRDPDLTTQPRVC